MEISYKDCEFDKEDNNWIVSSVRLNLKLGINKYPQVIIVEGQTGLRVAYYFKETAMHNMSHRYLPLAGDRAKAKHTGLILQI